MTEYRETGYGSDGYPPRESGDPGRGGTVYGGAARHTRDEDSASGQDDRGYGGSESAYGGAYGPRVPRSVWRPTRGPRAGEAAQGPTQGYGAPERGWRTADGGYKTADGGWRAPYRPYDTGEWRRDQRLDTGPTSTGEMARYSSGSGETVRYTPPATGEPTAYRAGGGDAARYPDQMDRAEETPRRPGGTGEIARYRGGAGEAPGYPPAGPAGAPASGMPRHPASGLPRHPASSVPRYQDDGQEAGHYPGGRGEYPGGRSAPSRQSGGSGEIVPYRGDPAESPRFPGAGPRSTGEMARYSAAPGPHAPEVPRYPAVDDGIGRGYPTDGTGRGYPTNGTGRGYPTDGTGRGYPTGGTERYPTDGTGRIARPGRAGAGADPGGSGRMAADPGDVRGYPAATAETTRIPRQASPAAPAAGHPAAPPKRDDSPELYSYDPLTLGGGESPAMRYDSATESYSPTPPAAEPPVPPSGVPDPRRSPGADPRAAVYEAQEADPRIAGPRAAEAGVYGRPPRPIEWAPPAGQDVSARQSADRRSGEPPVRRPPTRPRQRFEGTYPSRMARDPRNVVPPRGRSVVDEDEPDDSPGYLHTALVTTAWYTIPLLLYTMYVLTLDGSASAGDGQSARENALNGLLGGMPRVGVALVTSLAVALLIRAISKGWRAATIGFASAVVGGGAATVIFAALQG